MSSSPIIQRVALFQTIGEWPHTSAWTNHRKLEDGSPDDSYCPDGYVRVSEWQDVSFVQRPADELVSDEVASLAEAREKVIDEFTKQLAAIDGRMSELRSITHQPVQA